ncbi:uncharacterized protein LOC121836528 [Ixodes scapularis]|uniref:uncharacterized protein LOC121836528 n=1 Tax=Ixodes scapularis TaxID=6945 RepID=UPI001C37EA51|nr:uncharacterized protein LOC121836528 [Ixodes scapularis]
MPLPGCRNLAPPLLLLLVALTTLLALATPAACSGPRAADSAEDAEDSDASAEVQRRLRHAGGPRSQDHVLAEDEAAGAAAGSSEEDVALGDEPADDGGDAVKHPRGTSRFLQLYCRTGYNLVIHAGGKVNGTREDRNRYGGCWPAGYLLSSDGVRTPARQCACLESVVVSVGQLLADFAAGAGSREEFACGRRNGLMVR